VGGGFAGVVPNSNFTVGLYNESGAVPMISPGTLSNFTFTFRANTSKYTVTVQKNGVNTAITCTILSSAKSCSDTTHTVTFAQSDTVLVVASNGGDNSSTNPAWHGDYQ
jgi:hypothetical protein